MRAIYRFAVGDSVVPSSIRRQPSCVCVVGQRDRYGWDASGRALYGKYGCILCGTPLGPLRAHGHIGIYYLYVTRRVCTLHRAYDLGAVFGCVFGMSTRPTLWKQTRTSPRHRKCATRKRRTEIDDAKLRPNPCYCSTSPNEWRMRFGYNVLIHDVRALASIDCVRVTCGPTDSSNYRSHNMPFGEATTSSPVDSATPCGSFMLTENEKSLHTKSTHSYYVY